MPRPPDPTVPPGYEYFLYADFIARVVAAARYGGFAIVQRTEHYPTGGALRLWYATPAARVAVHAVLDHFDRRIAPAIHFFRACRGTPIAASVAAAYNMGGTGAAKAVLATTLRRLH